MEPVQVLGSENRIVHSSSTGRDYQIMVALPVGYHAQEGEQWPFKNLPERWPVVYVLDGNWYFGMVAGMVRTGAWCGGTTDCIVVGVGYPEEAREAIAGFRTAFTRRDHDLTPVHDAKTEQGQSEFHGRAVPNGDGANFLRFLKDELVPLIEGEYRADPAQRILAGHSYGGLFALQAMLREPELFSTIIAASPYLAYADRGTFALEEAYAKDHSDLAARLFLTATVNEQGSDDTTLADTLLIAEQLRKRGYAGLSLETKIFTEFNHCEGAPPAFHAGLVYALKK